MRLLKEYSNNRDAEDEVFVAESPWKSLHQAVMRNLNKSVMR
jgi:hypothetical protein